MNKTAEMEDNMNNYYALINSKEFIIAEIRPAI